MSDITVSQVTQAMGLIAPLAYAEAWDNVGLLIDGVSGHFNSSDKVESVLLTIDLTNDVLEEALAADIQLIISYHPPIFDGLKSLNGKNARERMILMMIANGISVYSPHTALDAAPGGMGDWLAEACGPGVMRPIQPKSVESSSVKIVVMTPKEDLALLRDSLSEIGCGLVGEYSNCAFVTEGTGFFKGSSNSNPVVGESGKLEEAKELRLEMICPEHLISRVAEVIVRDHPYEEPAWDAFKLVSKPDNNAGSGRIVTLNDPMTIDELIPKIKLHLGMEDVRVATSFKHRRGGEIQTVAYCPGAGGQLFEQVKADLYVTGEMRHHDVLQKVEEGGSVVVTDHTNTERGYLRRLKLRLQSMLGEQVEVLQSVSDRDPLQIQ